MRFQELPDFPPLWIDFAEGSPSVQPVLPERPDILSLLERFNRAQFPMTQREDLYRLLNRQAEEFGCGARSYENIKRLRRPRTAVILANHYVSLFGGPTSQILKCLTAVKLCAELEQRGVTAVPLCWIGGESSSQFPRWSIHLLDCALELRSLRLEQSDTINDFPIDSSTLGRIAELVSQIKELGGGLFASEILEIMAAAYLPGVTLFNASARLLSALMNDWGLILLDHQSSEIHSLSLAALASFGFDSARAAAQIQKQAASLVHAGYDTADQFAGERISQNTLLMPLIQSSILPIIASVVDASEIYASALIMPLFRYFDLVQPVIWPQASATIIDAKNQRLLERYNLSIKELFAGDEELLQRVGYKNKAQSVLAKLDGLQLEIKSRWTELEALARGEVDLVKTVDSSRERITFQIDKVRRRVAYVSAERQEAASRQIKRLCNFLAPEGRIQERTLAGIYFLLRYSRSALGILNEKLDVLNFEHQIISMD